MLRARRTCMRRLCTCTALTLLFCYHVEPCRMHGSRGFMCLRAHAVNTVFAIHIPPCRSLSGQPKRAFCARLTSGVSLSSSLAGIEPAFRVCWRRDRHRTTRTRFRKFCEHRRPSETHTVTFTALLKRSHIHSPAKCTPNRTVACARGQCAECTH